MNGEHSVNSSIEQIGIEDDVEYVPVSITKILQLINGTDATYIGTDTFIYLDAR